jgi:Fe-S-cluster containining protein
LRFECVPDCGACCTRHDDFAYVYLEGDDLPRLARHLGITQRTFRNRYTMVDDGDVVLKMVEPACPFLEGARCTVYAARPVQCRTFPFWKETLRGRRSWTRLKRFCPGIDRGDRHGRVTIERHLADRELD